MFENGFVLLTSPNFDGNQFFKDLQKDWQIVVQKPERQDDSFSFSVGDFSCVIGFLPAPIPNNEAVHRAMGNYMCPNAVDVAKAHTAHLMVTVIAQTQSSEIALMKLYSKIVATILKQNTAIGVYTSGTVFTADFYQKVTQQYLADDENPIMLWVFVGLGQNEQGNQLYTIGMNKFNKDEMEILNSPLPMQTLHTSLLSMCSYIITANLTLKDGETVGFSETQKWQITRSKSVYADSEMSLKVGVV